jgi:hypothetical protein
MRGKIHPRVLALVACLLISPISHSAVIITAVETGGDVVFSMAEGQSLDTSGLSFSGNIGEVARIIPSVGLLSMGPDLGVAHMGRAYSGATAPSNFGTGSNVFASSSTGVVIAVDNSGNVLVPTAYESNSLLGASSATYSGATIASLGMTPGTYVYDLGGVDTLTLQVVPVPAAVWLFGSALTGLGFVRRRIQAP